MKKTMILLVMMCTITAASYAQTGSQQRDTTSRHTNHKGTMTNHGKTKKPMRKTSTKRGDSATGSGSNPM